METKDFYKLVLVCLVLTLAIGISLAKETASIRAEHRSMLELQQRIEQSINQGLCFEHEQILDFMYDSRKF